MRTRDYTGDLRVVVEELVKAHGPYGSIEVRCPWCQELRPERLIEEHIALRHMDDPGVREAFAAGASADEVLAR